MFVLFIVAGVMESSAPNGMDENSPQVMFLGLGILAVGAMLVFALILGVAGLFQHDRNKVFAIIGTAISGVVVLGTAGLIVIGLLIGS